MSIVKDIARQIWAIGSPRYAGCAVPAPWWTNRATGVAIGAPLAIVNGLLVPAGASAVEVFLQSIALIVPLMTAMWIAGMVDARRVPWHLHCDTCGICSIGAGVAGARTVREADAAGRRAGWWVGTNSCPVIRCPRCRTAIPVQALTEGWAPR